MLKKSNKKEFLAWFSFRGLFVLIAALVTLVIIVMVVVAQLGFSGALKTTVSLSGPSCGPVTAIFGDSLYYSFPDDSTTVYASNINEAEQACFEKAREAVEPEDWMPGHVSCAEGCEIDGDVVCEVGDDYGASDCYITAIPRSATTTHGNYKCFGHCVGMDVYCEADCKVEETPLPSPSSDCNEIVCSDKPGRGPVTAKGEGQALLSQGLSALWSAANADAKDELAAQCKFLAEGTRNCDTGCKRSGIDYELVSGTYQTLGSGRTSCEVGYLCGWVEATQRCKFTEACEPDCGEEEVTPVPVSAEPSPPEETSTPLVPTESYEPEETETMMP